MQGVVVRHEPANNGVPGLVVSSELLLALAHASAAGRATLTTNCVDLVEEHNARRFALAWAKRSRTRLAPTPANISTNAEPAVLKNGTPASPATARASSVLPVPGGPT